MKLSGLTLIALAAGTLVAAAPVAAQRHVEVQRTTTVVRETNRGYHPVVVVHDDRGRHRGWNNRRHKTCRTNWVHHRKVTRCWYNR